MTALRYVRVEGVAHPVAFCDCDALTGLIDDVLQGWDMRSAAPPDDGGAPSLTIARRQGRWRCASAATGKSATYSDPVATVCWLAANLVRCQTLDDPSLLCLHAASVEIGGGLVVMPSRFRAGKSVLSAALAAMGLRVFGDDVLPVDPDSGDGVAAGIAPRLRLPLPDSLAPGTREFIDAHQGPQGKRYLYLDLPEALFAPRGTRRPIRGIALLERVDDAPAKMTRVPEGDALKQVIWQNFGREGAATAILDRLAEITARAPCLTLRYARPEDGARALVDAFAAPSLSHIPEAPFLLDAERKAATASGGLARLTPDSRLRRVEGCEVQTRAGRRFLIGAEGLTIMALNELAAALWRLLEVPSTYGEVLEVVTAAFPDQDEARIDADLRGLIVEMSRQGVATIAP